MSITLAELLEAKEVLESIEPVLFKVLVTDYDTTTGTLTISAKDLAKMIRGTNMTETVQLFYDMTVENIAVPLEAGHNTTVVCDALFNTLPAGSTAATVPAATVGAAINTTNITTNGGTTGTVTSGGAYTGTSAKTIYVKLSTLVPVAAEPYGTVSVSYCVDNVAGTYTSIGTATGAAQALVDGVTVMLGTSGVYEDGEIYSIACTPASSTPTGCYVPKAFSSNGMITFTANPYI